MADLTYKITGVNTAQLANEVRILRQRSSTFRALEASAAAAGYATIEIRMGAGLLKDNLADSGKVNSSTWGMRINSDTSGSWGVGGRQATVGEVIAHELAHAVVPQEFREPGVYDFTESGKEGMWVRRRAGQVAVDLGLPGANNADYLITKIPIDKEQVCTTGNSRAVKPQDGVLFLDGSRGYNGRGSTIPPGSGSQDSINSRRLATDEIEQEFTPLRAPTAGDLPSDETQGTVSDKPERRLGRRTVNSSPASASQATVPAMPFVPSNGFGNWTSSPDDITPRNPNLPVPPPSSGRPLGIFKPMPLWTTPPPLGGLLDNSNAAGNNDRNWFTALAGNSISPTGGSGDTRSSPTPEPQQSQGPTPAYIQEYLQYLSQLNGNHSWASVFDPGVPAAPFDVSDPTPFSGGLQGRLAALAGIDPQNPNQFAPPLLDDEQEQADLRALDARLSSSGDIRDAVALYNARKSSRR